jgi:hypothetical protein
MPRDTKKTLKRLAARLFTLPVETYLTSEKFSDFCRKYDVYDAWQEYLVLSRDTPDLYGSAVTKNAFVLFLHHIFHSRTKEFPELFSLFLIDFSQEITCVLPFDDLKKDLMQLGYSEREIDTGISDVKAMNLSP